MSRRTIFVIALSYLSVILALGLLFFVKREWLCFVPQNGAFGPVAVGVPWFGALGAVLISLTGVFQHEHDWDASYWPWHLARPLIGVALGVVSVLILQAGVLSVTSNGNSSPPPNSLLYYLVAFLVGYREETFRELIKRLVDVILSPGDGAGPAPAITDVDPPNAPHDTSSQVTVNGSGFTSTQSVRFGSSAAKFTINSDGKLTVTTPTAPTGPFPLEVSLTVTTKNGSATIPFKFT
jgi:hypothetical protein